MELILHFGTHKTGSSSIQDTLYKNLDDPRVTYINFGTANSSLWINYGFSEDWDRRPTFARLKLSQQDKDARKSQARKAIAKRLSAADTSKSILSAEAIAYLKPKELAALIEFIRPFTSSIRAIGYVRPPKSYTESVIQERIKRIPIEFKKSLVSIRYRRVIDGLDAVLGKDKVEVYKFDRGTLKDGCIVKDFCHRAGIEIRTEDVVSSNEGLSRQAVQMLYLLWKYYPDLHSRRIPKIQALIMKLRGQEIDTKVDRKILDNAIAQISQFPGDRMYLHSDAYQKLASIDSDELDWLEQRTGITFDEDIYAHDDTGFKREKDIMKLQPHTVRLLLDKLNLGSANAPKLLKNNKLLAQHIYMLAHKS